MKRVTRPKRWTLMHAASRMIICSFFMSRHFWRSRVYDGSLGWVVDDESALFFFTTQPRPIHRSDGSPRASTPPSIRSSCRSL